MTISASLRKAALALAALAAAAAAVAPGALGRGWSGWCRHGSPGVTRTAATCGGWILAERAVPPPSAPTVVRRVIRAANRIDRRPYVWGGGHRRWWTKGYDCSGAVGYALHGAGLLDVTMVSGQLAHWGEPGGGRWITIYANDRHVFMVVAGLRFDTRDPPLGETGPRWHEWMIDSHRFVARHPPGL